MFTWQENCVNRLTNNRQRALVILGDGDDGSVMDRNENGSERKMGRNFSILNAYHMQHMHTKTRTHPSSWLTPVPTHDATTNVDGCPKNARLPWNILFKIIANVVSRVGNSWFATFELTNHNKTLYYLCNVIIEFVLWLDNSNYATQGFLSPVVSWIIYLLVKKLATWLAEFHMKEWEMPDEDRKGSKTELN